MGLRIIDIECQYRDNFLYYRLLFSDQSELFFRFTMDKCPSDANVQRIDSLIGQDQTRARSVFGILGAHETTFS